MRQTTFLVLALLAASGTSISVSELITPLQLTNATLDTVKDNLWNHANASWEKGTAAEALTEYSWPSLSVFSNSAFPPPVHLSEHVNASDVLYIARSTVTPGVTVSKTLVSDGSVGDPASLGVAVLLANWTRTDRNDSSYAVAATNQLDYLLQEAPRTPDGAISHRSDQTQLWADFIYMAPPFIAYYGALVKDDNLLQIAYDQIRLYRNHLRDTTTGLWRHIGLGTWQDDTLWATGNGWAAAGMLRVLETINRSGSTKFTEQKEDLTQWIQEIVNATWTHQGANGTLFNAINDENSFADSASTALLASVTYRMAVLTKDNTTNIASANLAYQLVQRSIDEKGWLRNTVDPLTFNTPSAPDSVSPEGQAFVLLLQAAYRDYLEWRKFDKSLLAMKVKVL